MEWDYGSGLKCSYNNGSSHCLIPAGRWPQELPEVGVNSSGLYPCAGGPEVHELLESVSAELAGMFLVGPSRSGFCSLGFPPRRLGKSWCKIAIGELLVKTSPMFWAAKCLP